MRQDDKNKIASFYRKGKGKGFEGKVERGLKTRLALTFSTVRSKGEGVDRTKLGISFHGSSLRMVMAEKAPREMLLFCKRDCATCRMVVPVIREIETAGLPLTLYTQDDPSFPEAVAAVQDDTSLEQSFRFGIEAVPTLILLEKGREKERVVGWDRERWRAVTGLPYLGEDLPPFRPGCGAKNVEPGMAEELAVRFGAVSLQSRRLEVPPGEDEMEVCFHRGWSDGLPVVPPTPVRVVRMLKGTPRSPQEVLGCIPPNQIPCTVEKAAINAVMAGCRPEYFPVVLAAVEAALREEFCLHGLLATTYFSGPVVIVNGPVRQRIGMNSGINALGQGNRANATIGRALQLIVRNVGGGRPGEIDRAVLGNPGKYTFCFAEDEEGSPWEPLSVERGFARGASTVTLFPGDGVQPVVDQLSRTPESLARTFAWCLRTVAHPKIPLASDAVLVVSPEHGEVFRRAGWSKHRLREEINGLLQLPGKELVRGAQGIAEGIPEGMAGVTLPKFKPGGLILVHAGGKAGKFSAIISGWIGSHAQGSQPVTQEISS